MESQALVAAPLLPFAGISFSSKGAPTGVLTPCSVYPNHVSATQTGHSLWTNRYTKSQQQIHRVPCIASEIKLQASELLKKKGRKKKRKKTIPQE